LFGSAGLGVCFLNVIASVSDLSAEALAKAEAIHLAARGDMDCFVASAPLRKRVAFVAGNDEAGFQIHISNIDCGCESASSRRIAPELCK
jgi:hypothetical protein